MNVTGAVISYLRADSVITGLVSQRIFGPGGNSPADPMRKEMATWGPTPRKTVIVMASGGAATGAGANSNAPWLNNRLDIRCYGETPYQADVLQSKVYRRMKDLRGYSYQDANMGDVDLIDAVVAGGPLPGRDTDADWPYTLGVYAVSAKHE